MRPQDADTMLTTSAKTRPMLRALEDVADDFAQAAWEDAQFTASDSARRVFGLSVDLSSALDDLEIAISRLVDRPPARKR